MLKEGEEEEGEEGEEKRGGASKRGDKVKREGGKRNGRKGKAKAYRLGVLQAYKMICKAELGFGRTALCLSGGGSLAMGSVASGKARDNPNRKRNETHETLLARARGTAIWAS